MHPALAEKYVSQCRQLEREGDCPTIKMPPAEQLMFALLEVADERDRLAATIRRLTKLEAIK